MNTRVRRHPLIALVVVIVFLAIVGIGAYALDLAGSMNALPWQAVPTPYSGGAFEGIPGFGGALTTSTATPTAIATP